MAMISRAEWNKLNAYLIRIFRCFRTTANGSRIHAPGNYLSSPGFDGSYGAWYRITREIFPGASPVALSEVDRLRPFFHSISVTRNKISHYYSLSFDVAGYLRQCGYEAKIDALGVLLIDNADVEVGGHYGALDLRGVSCLGARIRFGNESNAIMAPGKRLEPAGGFRQSRLSSFFHAPVAPAAAAMPMPVAPLPPPIPVVVPPPLAVPAPVPVVAAALEDSSEERSRSSVSPRISTDSDDTSALDPPRRSPEESPEEEESLEEKDRSLKVKKRRISPPDAFSARQEGRDLPSPPSPSRPGIRRRVVGGGSSSSSSSSSSSGGGGEPRDGFRFDPLPGYTVFSRGGVLPEQRAPLQSTLPLPLFAKDVPPEQSERQERVVPLSPNHAAREMPTSSSSGAGGVQAVRASFIASQKSAQPDGKENPPDEEAVDRRKDPFPSPFVSALSLLNQARR